MSLFEKMAEEHENRLYPHDDRSDGEEDLPAPTPSASARIQKVRQGTVTVGGSEVPMASIETTQTTGDDESWLTGTKYGRPRGRKAIQARKISQTAAMESITNGIVDQLLGGELVAESDDDDTDQSEAEFWEFYRDVLEGPHPMGNDLDDLITAAVADMMGPGNAYWQFIGSRDESIPVLALIPLDALTIRHNIAKNGLVPEDEPAYYQARNAFSVEGVASEASIEPTGIERDRIAVMHYPRGKRSYQIYPKSPSLQVLEWLEILTNSTTHHNRFYNDNELPPGFIQILNASGTTVEDVKERIQAAKGDPRKVEVIGGEGQAMWVEMAGSSINLDVIEEQKWFFQLCLGSLGLGKAELGFIEDANRSNGEVEQTRIYKRIAGPFSKQFNQAFKHGARQFDLYNALDEPFDPVLRFSDPDAERARQKRLREEFQAGTLTLRQLVRRRGDQDIADNDLTVEIDGIEVNYGDHPKWVARELIAEARSSEDRPMDEEGDGDDEESQDLESAVRNGESHDAPEVERWH